MKKSIVALAIAAAAVSGAANAKIDVYNNDGLAVQLSGEVQAHMVTGQGKLEQKGQNDIKEKTDPNTFGFGLLQVDAQYDISSSTTAFASFELEGKSGTGDKVVTTDDVVVGFEHVDAGKFSFGETGHSLGALEKTDISNEAFYAGNLSHPSEDGKGVRWEKEVAGVAFSADVQTDKESELNYYTLGADWAVNDVFTIGAAYMDGGKTQASDTSATGKVENNYKTNTYGISASAQLDALYLAATVTQYNGMNKIETTGEIDVPLTVNTDTNGMTYGFAAAYQMDATRFYGTFALVDAKEDSASESDTDAELMAITVGVDQELTSNVKVYAEYTNLSIDTDNLNNDTEATEDLLMVGGYFTF